MFLSLDARHRGAQFGGSDPWPVETDKERVVHLKYDDKESVMSKKNCSGLLDCGRVSTRTRGLPYQLLFEAVSPPFNRIFLTWP
jgi:hypothetical protein